MLGISTSWNAGNHNDARSMMEEIKNLGIDCVELNFKLDKKMVNGIVKLVDERFIRVLSLHNFCPVPDSIELKDASPDYYSLASLDEGERERAVKHTKHTIDMAARLKAEAVVIHSGRLEIKDKTRELAAAAEQGVDTSLIIESMRKERDEEKKRGYLERAIKSLEALSDYSKSCGIKIGLENRFYFRELPSIREFEEIFRHFPESSNIYYWHDTGHAQAHENLGLARHKDYLEKFSSRLLGAHLHDVKGVIRDHMAPLTGSFDFSILKPYLKKDTLKILEPHFPSTAEDVQKAFEYIKKLYGEG